MARDDNSIERRGGARAGCGRKKSDRKVDIHIRISREAYEKLQQIKNKAEWLDELIRANA